MRTVSGAAPAPAADSELAAAGVDAGVAAAAAAGACWPSAAPHCPQSSASMDTRAPHFLSVVCIRPPVWQRRLWRYDDLGAAALRIGHPVRGLRLFVPSNVE